MDRSERLARLEELRELAPLLEAAREELQYRRDEFSRLLGKRILSTTYPVDQRYVDRRRGFWEGAVWAYTAFLDQADGEMEKMILEARVGETL